jgi:hypothetical protein
VTPRRDWLAAAVVVLGVATAVLVLAASLDRDAYYYYPPERRQTFEYPFGTVALVLTAVVVEFGSATALLKADSVGPRWARGLLSLGLLVPISIVGTASVVHAPGFILVHHLALWALIALLSVVVTVSGLSSVVRALIVSRPA